ncbi:MAG: O-antigen ligase family protein, partial [Chromatiales bacterium]|nr:O-antigen ligase family protein [Chromatiales bacterium]
MAGLIQVGIGFFGLQQHSSLYAAEVNASFANRNHLANYLTLCIAAGLGLLLAKMNNSTPGDWRGSLRHAIDWLMSGKMRLRFALLLMAITIVLTRSRMGNVAFFSSMLIAGVLTLALTRQRRRGLVILVSSIVAIDIVVIGSMVGIERVAQRLEDTSLVAETRDEVARDTIEYWRDFPLTGSGLGSFSVTFPRYKHGDVSLFYKRAHNDYLQFAAETGVIGVLLLGCLILLSIGIAIRTLHRRHDPLALGISFAVVMSGAAVLIHATVEFNLQTYANAATFCVVLAMGWVAANLPRRRGTDAAIATPPPRKRLTAAAALLAIVVYVAWTLSTAGADLINRSNTQFLAGWTDKGVAKADTVRAVMRRQIDAIHLAPHDAQAKILLARLAWWQLRVSEDRPDSEKVYDQMLYALLDATRDNPGLGSVWTS